MEAQIIQNLRHKLQKRVQRLNVADVDTFILYLQHFWRFFDRHAIYVGIISLLVSKYPNIESDTVDILNGEVLSGESEEEAAVIGYSVLRKISELAYASRIYQIAQLYAQNSSKKQDITEIIRFTFLEPFSEYVDEQLDNRKIILSLLIRYKHRSEWFYRNHLLHLSQNDSQRAEKMLALDFYSYLYDQGLDFTIEPSSLSGEIDIAAAQGTDDPLLADAKIFDASDRGKRYIRKAFNQIYTYTQQYNEPFGYLLIFKITDRDLSFSLSNNFLNIPVVIYNHKTIFLITIDIYSHSKPVSQRNPLSSIVITEEELIQPLEDEDVQVH